MRIRFAKLGDDAHRLSVDRDDGSSETIELESRGFLRHDLAHYAVEVELGLTGGFWGWVAAGGSLHGQDIDTDEIMVAESIAGPVQSLMRADAPAESFSEVLRARAPERADDELGRRIHERVRRLRGHWNGTGYGDEMVLPWPAPPL